MIVPRLRRALAAPLAAALLAAPLGGCSGVRLESSPPPMPSPDAQEVTRQALALAADDIAQLAAPCAADGGTNAELYRAIEQRATQQSQALGGAWRPFASASPSPHQPLQPASPPPSTGTAATADPGQTSTGPAGSPSAPSRTESPSSIETPSTTSSPPPSPTASPGAAGCDPVAIGRALAASAAAARTAAAEGSDVTLVTLAASISSAQYLDYARVAAADDAPTTRSVPSGWLTDANAPVIDDAAAAAAIVRNEDALAYTEEYVAGTITDEDQRATLLTEAALHRRAGDAVANANGLVAAKDPRLPVYRLPAATATAAELTEQLDAMRRALPQGYLDAIAHTERAGREAMLAALLQALQRAERAGAEPSALPGLR